jgi:formylglycine-generating enzyme required for sulfatase activity
MNQLRSTSILAWVAVAVLSLGATAGAQEAIVKTSQGLPLVRIPGSTTRIALWETRVSDWRSFLAATGHAWNFKAPFEQGEDHPAVGISAEDAQAFCDWLTRIERSQNQLRTNQTYRLPTEQEWLALTVKRPDGGLSRFPWGDDWPPPSGVGNLADRSFMEWKDGHIHTAPVGSFPAGVAGVHDLVGNVWEWVQAGTSGSQARLRGGAWAYLRETVLMTDYVYEVPLSLRAPTIGFRIALSEGTTTAPIASNTVSPATSVPSATTPSTPAVAASGPGSASVVTPAPAEPATVSPAMASAGDPGGDEFSSDVDALLRKLAGGVKAMDQSIQNNLRPAAEGEPFTNGLGMEFLPLEGVDAVLMAKFEVRSRDYDQWLRETGRVWESKPAFLIGGESAAASVSFDSAKQFCGWLTLKDWAGGLIPSNAVYRLPKDREWSIAAGLGRETWEQPEQRHLGDEESFPWGSEWPPPAGSVNLDSKKIEGYEDEFPYTAPVRSGQPNEAGFHNLGGNVSEWCEDTWSTRSAEMVIRGGSWLISDREAALSSHRARALPKIIRPDVGFRCVLDLKSR